MRILAIGALLLGIAGLTPGQEFEFVAPDVVEGYSGTSHTFDLDILVGQVDTPLIVTYGMSCGLGHEADEIEAIDVEPTGILDLGGIGPAFFGVALVDGGWTMGAVWGGGHGAKDPLEFDGLQPSIKVTYEADVAAGGDVTTPLTWTDNLGAPPVTNVIVTFQAQSITPNLVDGSITLSPQSFQRGDCNADGTVNLADDITLLVYVFVGTITPPCDAACDFNGDGSLGIADAIFIEQYLFLSGPAPPPPLGACGINDGLVECLEYAPCP